jgi:hypothetical protein
LGTKKDTPFRGKLSLAEKEKMMALKNERQTAKKKKKVLNLVTNCIA